MDYLFGPENYRWLLDVSNLRFLIQGFGINVATAAMAAVLSLILALPLALLRLQRNRVVARIAGTWIDVWRNLPTALVVLYVALATPSAVQEAVEQYAPGWFPEPMRSSGVIVGVVGLTLYYSALIAEVYRAGINAVPVGQVQAATALGLPRRDALRFVIVPQGVRAMTPALISQVISLVKNTTLISIIAVPEALRHAQILANSNFFSTGPQVPLLHVFVLTGLLFIALNIVLSRVSRSFETHSHVRSRSMSFA